MASIIIEPNKIICYMVSIKLLISKIRDHQSEIKSLIIMMVLFYETFCLEWALMSTISPIVAVIILPMLFFLYLIMLPYCFNVIKQHFGLLVVIAFLTIKFLIILFLFYNHDVFVSAHNLPSCSIGLCILMSILS